MMGLKDQFQNITKIGPEFRPVSFWSWNDDLKLDELKRQLHEMAVAGLGGHFMHARPGLITEYMGPAWIQLVKGTVAASKAERIHAWLYDEDCWPSGPAGGAVPAKDPLFTCKILRWQTVPPAQFKPTQNTIATFLVDGETGEVIPVLPHLAARKSSFRGHVLHFHHVDNASYIDVMNPAAVKEFVKHTYDGYRSAVGADFGKTVPGVFTDEPAWGYAPGWDVIPWSPELPKFFKKINGYELLPKLPAMALQTPDSASFRYDFWKTATQLFVDSFTRQIGDWCKKKKLAFTGHLMSEDSLQSQLRYTGAAMPHYPWMDIPGIDQLGCMLGTPLLCTQVASVANQFGKRRVLSEMYGGSGWNVSFERLKWLAEWQFAQGINLSCTHLNHYSLLGSRKRDYPPSLHYQQPWWPDYKRFNDYLARLALMLTRGKRTPQVLVLHTIESAWAVCNGTDFEQIHQLNTALTGLITALQQTHIDFDLGDESILAANARVTAKQLRVKNAAYRLLIIPPCITLRTSTLTLIDRFRKAGGHVLRIDAPLPTLADARASELPAKVLGGIPAVKLAADAIKQEIVDLSPPAAVNLTTADGLDAATVLLHHRDAGTEQIYFCANTSPTHAVDASIELPSGRIEEWDAETGAVRPLAAKKSHGKLVADLHLEPMGSRLLVVGRGKKPAAVRQAKQRVIEQLILSDNWSVERLDLNALTLDTCSYRIGRGDWSPPTPVLTVQDNLRHITGTETCEFKYAFEAAFSSKLPQTLQLAVEEPDSCEISINGFPIARPEGQNLGWWRDIAFRRLDISGLLKPQDRNEIVIRRSITGEIDRKRQMTAPGITPEQKNRLRFAGEIESIYIIGDFLVRSSTPWEQLDRRALRTSGPFVLTDTWSQIKAGDLITQGYPFYAGRVRLTQGLNLTEKQIKAMKGARLVLDPPDAITFNLIINGRHAGFRAWRPYTLEIGEFLVPGRNEFKLELAGSCRNLLGPHHHIAGELDFVSPGSFRGTRSWTDPADTPERTWTDAYSFARFGLAGSAAVILWK